MRARLHLLRTEHVIGDDDLAGRQQEHWQHTYAEHPGMYGWHPSEPAVYAAGVMAGARARHVLELGAGHGRDALYFAAAGLTVTATDFSSTGPTQQTYSGELLAIIAPDNLASQNVCHKLGFTFWKQAPVEGDIRNLYTLPVGDAAP